PSSVTWKMPGSSWIERRVVPVGSGLSPMPATRGQRRRSRSMARRLTVGAFGSTERKRKNGQRAEAEAADARPAKVDDRLEVDPEPAVLIVDAPAHPAAREHQRPRAIVVLVIVTAVTGIAATAGAVATAVVGTSATTGVAAGIA